MIRLPDHAPSVDPQRARDELSAVWEQLVAAVGGHRPARRNAVVPAGLQPGPKGCRTRRTGSTQVARGIVAAERTGCGTAAVTASWPACRCP